MSVIPLRSDPRSPTPVVADPTGTRTFNDLVSAYLEDFELQRYRSMMCWILPTTLAGAGTKSSNAYFNSLGLPTLIEECSRNRLEPLCTDPYAR